MTLKTMVSVSVRYLFYQPVDENIKTHWTLLFPAKENPNFWEGIVRSANLVVVWRQREVSIDF